RLESEAELGIAANEDDGRDRDRPRASITWWQRWPASTPASHSSCSTSADSRLGRASVAGAALAADVTRKDAERPADVDVERELQRASARDRQPHHPVLGRGNTAVRRLPVRGVAHSEPVATRARKFEEDVALREP